MCDLGVIGGAQTLKVVAERALLTLFMTVPENK